MLTQLKKGKGYVFAFNTPQGEPDTALCSTARQVLTEAVRQANPNPASGTVPAAEIGGAATSHLLSGQASVAQGPSRFEVELRAQVLREDPGVAADHATLVKGGLVEENAFWEAREALLERWRMRHAQKGALRSSKPIIGLSSRQEAKLTFSMTLEKQRHIFSLEPHTQVAWRRLVQGGGMSAAEFWKNYITAGKEWKRIELQAARDCVEPSAIRRKAAKAGEDEFFFNLACGKWGGVQMPAGDVTTVARTMDLTATQQEVLHGTGVGYGTRESTTVYDETTVHTGGQGIAGGSRDERERAARMLALEQKGAHRVMAENNFYSSVVLQGGSEGAVAAAPAVEHDVQPLVDLMALTPEQYAPVAPRASSAVTGAGEVEQAAFRPPRPSLPSSTSVPHSPEGIQAALDARSQYPDRLVSLRALVACMHNANDT